MTSEAPGRPKRRRVRLVLLSVGALVAVALAAAAWVGVRGWLAKGELEAAADAAGSVMSAMSAQDRPAAVREAERLDEHASEAAALTGDPVWAAAQVIPWIGDDLRAVGAMAAALAKVSAEAVLPLSTTVADLDAESLRDPEGRMDIDRIAASAPVVHRAATAIGVAADEVAAIPSRGLLGPVAGARTRFLGALTEASTVARGADDALTFIPAALGQDAPRQYLMLSLNNAELRTAGGIAGAIALVRIDGGRLTIVRQASTSDFAKFDPPLAVDQGMRSVFGDDIGSYIQNTTMTPDFAETGELTAAMWQRVFGDRIDGVVALDPVALSYLLQSTGLVTVDGADPIDAANAVSRLLVEPYQDPTFEQAARDRYFSSIAAGTFDAMLHESVDLGTLAWAVAEAGAEHRISMWSADAGEQAMLERSPFSGLLAAQAEAGPQTYGVYLNDTTAAKLDPYLDVAIDVGAVQTRADAHGDVTVRVTLTDAVTPADLARMPIDASGAYREGYGNGRITTIVTVRAPDGAFNGGVFIDGVPVPSLARDVAGATTSSLTVDLEPGEQAIVEFRFVSAEPSQTEPHVVHTPLFAPLEVGAL